MVRFGTAVAAALVPMLLAACNPQTTSSPPVAAPEPPQVVYDASELRDLTAAEKAALGQSIAKGLKDPDSARFQWLRFPKAPRGDSVTWCGMVNAKNSYGGYTGSKPFMALVLVKNGRPVGGVLSLAGSDDFSINYIRSECRKHGWDPFLAV